MNGRRRRRWRCVWIIALSLLASAARAEDYIQPEAASLAPAKLATLLWRESFTIEVEAIDGTPIDVEGSRWHGSGRAVLLPGKHTIELRATHGGSPMRCGIVSGRGARLQAYLKAGHTYVARTDKSSFTCQIFIWLEDKQSGLVVAGAPPPGDPDRMRRSAQAVGAQLVEATYDAISARAAAGDGEALYRFAIWHLLGDEPLAASDPQRATRLLRDAAARGYDPAVGLLERLETLATAPPREAPR